MTSDKLIHIWITRSQSSCEKFRHIPYLSIFCHLSLPSIVRCYGTGTERSQGMMVHERGT